MREKFIALSLAALAAGSAFSQTVTLSTGPYGFGNGGEFNAVFNSVPLSPVALTNSGNFEVFCLEHSENFSPGGTYYFTIDTFAIAGGGGAVGGQDPLDETTAFLYDAFISGTLPGYDYANTFGMRSVNAGALQNAIWYIEQEVGTLDSADAVTFYNFAQGGIGRGLGDVRVLNMYTLDGDGHQVNAQSQVFKLPTPGTTALVGLAAAAGLRRRRRRYLLFSLDSYLQKGTRSLPWARVFRFG